MCSAPRICFRCLCLCLCRCLSPRLPQKSGKESLLRFPGISPASPPHSFCRSREEHIPENPGHCLELERRPLPRALGQAWRLASPPHSLGKSGGEHLPENPGHLLQVLLRHLSQTSGQGRGSRTCSEKSPLTCAHVRVPISRNCSWYYTQKFPGNSRSFLVASPPHPSAKREDHLPWRLRAFSGN